MAACSSTITSSPLAEVVVTEFMDAAAIAALRADFAVLYDPGLVDRPDDLAQAVTGARGLVVRNRTQVKGALLAAAKRLRFKHLRASLQTALAGRRRKSAF